MNFKYNNKGKNNSIKYALHGLNLQADIYFLTKPF